MWGLDQVHQPNWMEREGSLGLGPSKSPKGGEVIIYSGPLEINKRIHEGSKEPTSFSIPSLSSKEGVSSPRASPLEGKKKQREIARRT